MTPSSRGPATQWPSGQAFIELAVIGSFALLALNLLIQIGLRMNYQQEISQQTFRHALVISKSEGEKDESASTQLQHFRDRQVPDPSTGFGLMPRTSTNASATVTWGEWLTYLGSDPDSQSRIVFQVNDTRQEYRSGDFDVGSKSDPLVKHISKQVTVNGTVNQNVNGSSLSSLATETTTLTLKNNATVTGPAPPTPTNFDGPDWQITKE